METWQKHHRDRRRRMENSQSSYRRYGQVGRISRQSQLARFAHHDDRRMDNGIVEPLREEMNGIVGQVREEMNGIVGKLREEMILRFEHIDRRLDESFAAVTQQLVEQRAYTDFAYERLGKSDQSISAGITRLERKLDRILALAVESRSRRP
jgi:hypothetical protein